LRNWRGRRRRWLIWHVSIQLRISLAAKVAISG
jgi:hypothetical protein